MSELNEPRWAVISERGREAEGMPYAEAGKLVQELRGEKLGGLCVVTDAAASCLAPAAKVNKRRPAASNPKRAKRGTGKGTNA